MTDLKTFHILNKSKMRNSSCSCSCGNVRIRGQPIPQGVYPNIPPSERERLRFCKNLFSIQPQSIEIQNTSKVRGRLLSSICADMTCNSCGSTFRFFSSRGYSYFGRIQPDNSQSRQNILKNSQKPLTRDQIQPNASTPNIKFSPILNNDNVNSLTIPLPQLFMPLIAHLNPNQRGDQKSPPMRTTLDNINSNNIDNLDLNNEIEIDRNLANRPNQEETLFSNNDDIDFELMFSNNADPVVGSYKQHMGIPFDNALGNISSDFQPKSYFA